MPARILNGNAIRDQIYTELTGEIAALASAGIRPGLAAVLVGENPASKIYVSSKIAACEKLNLASIHVTPPATISTGELLARIRVALRHTAQTQNGNEAPVFQSGDLKVDLAARRVFVGDSEVHLTRIEYKLLTTLVRHVGKVLTHQFLLAEVWGPQQAENTQHLRVFMAGLRRKIEADPAQPRYLLTEQGVGYRLAGE